MKFFFAALISLISTSTSILAWDGDRQGFLLGYGAGTNSQFIGYPAERWEIENTSFSTSINNARIGYAFDNNFALLIYLHDLWSYRGDYETSFQGINVQRWSGTPWGIADESQSNCWFGGIGLIVRESNVKIKGVGKPDPDVGWGVNFGYGREIVNHASIEINLTIGGISYEGSNRALISISTTFHLLGY